MDHAARDVSGNPDSASSIRRVKAAISPLSTDPAHGVGRPDRTSPRCDRDKFPAFVQQLVHLLDAESFFDLRNILRNAHVKAGRRLLPGKGREFVTYLSLGNFPQRRVFQRHLLQGNNKRSTATLQLFHTCRNHVHENVGIVDDSAGGLKVVVSHEVLDWLMNAPRMFSGEFGSLKMRAGSSDVQIARPSSPAGARSPVMHLGNL